MARTIENGLNYFPKDTDFYSDRKIRRLLKSYGFEGVVIYDYLLCEIYKEEGYFMKWDNEIAFDISDSLHLTSEKSILEIVKFCINNDLFDKKIFDEKGVLTSRGIQKRFNSIVKHFRRKNGINDELMLINATLMPINATLIPINDALMHERKGKEKKVNEREVEERKKESKNYDFEPPPPPPTFEEFSEFAKAHKPHIQIHKTSNLMNRFKTWEALDWIDKDGNSICKYWKAKLLATLPYIEKEDLKNQNNYPKRQRLN